MIFLIIPLILKIILKFKCTCRAAVNTYFDSNLDEKDEMNITKIKGKETIVTLTER